MIYSVKDLKVFLLLLICSLGASGGLVTALGSEIAKSYLYFNLSWIAYFSAHYIENKCFLDGFESSSRDYVKKDLHRGYALSVFYLIGGILLAYGLNQSKFGFVWSGSTTILFTYALTHKILAGSLL